MFKFEIIHYFKDLSYDFDPSIKTSKTMMMKTKA